MIVRYKYEKQIIISINHFLLKNYYLGFDGYFFFCMPFVTVISCFILVFLEPK